MFKKNFSSFFWHYGVNKNYQGLPWTLGNLIVLHKKTQDIALKDGERIPGQEN